MKKLTKDQLIDLAFDKGTEIRKLNSENMGERVANIIEEPENDGGKMIVDSVVTYVNEIKRECCQVIAETLYEILYSE